MINKLALLLITVFVIVIFMKIVKSYNYSNKLENFQSESHNSFTCNYPFPESDECSNYLGNGDIHINRFEYPRNFPRNINIHHVDPNNPCCLRTCINDFTYTEDNIRRESRDLIGTYKQYIPKDLLYTSRCYECINKFNTAVTMIAEPDICLEQT